MTTKEVLMWMKKIHWERMLDAHHDSYDLHQPDLDALDCAIALIKFLDESNPKDFVKIEELLKATQLEH